MTAIEMGKPEDMKPPFPEERIEPPGIEADMVTRPRFLARDYKGSGLLQEKIALITGVGLRGRRRFLRLMCFWLRRPPVAILPVRL